MMDFDKAKVFDMPKGIVKPTIVPDTSIKVGDKVRSYDFPQNFEFGDFERGEKCFVEGTVVDITHEPPFSHGAYVIEVHRCVWDGEEKSEFNEVVYPPVNGLDQMFSDYPTHGVIKIK
jgi:hypothetical protein